ncbi:MAG: hypothetical protein ACXWDM_14180 [Nocardioides sp.]
MTDYPQYPSGASPEPMPGRAPLGPRPASLDMAVNLIWVAVALTVLSTIIGFLQIDDAVDAALEADTGGTLTEDSARAGVIAFIVIFLVVGVAIYALLALFIKRGKNWARIVFTVLAALFLVLGVLGLGSDQTTLSLIVGLVQIVLTAATLFYLWKPESSAYFSAS